MSKPRKRWWGYAKQAVKAYPQLEKALRDIQEPSITADISGMPKGSGTSRTVENLSLRQLDPDNQRDYDAVRKAVELTRSLATGKERLNLIKLVYWQNNPCRIKDAALMLFVDEKTAKRWHGDFIRLVGLNLFPKDVPQEPK